MAHLDDPGRIVCQERCKCPLKLYRAQSLSLSLFIGIHLSEMSEMSWPAIMQPFSEGSADEELLKKARALIRSGSVDVNAKYKGMTPLMYAVEQPELVKDLLVAGANIDAVDENGWTALMDASNRGRDDSSEILVQHGADVNAVTTKGMTALMIAAREDYAGVAQLLVDHGADLNAVDEKGWTATMHALMSDSSHSDYDDPMYEWLLWCGADPTIRNKDGDTALDMLTRHGYKDSDDVVMMLKSYLRIQGDDTASEMTECAICSEHKPTIVYTPCGHVSCFGCHRQWKKPECPHCRTRITSRLRLYL